jgi:hypothetical protein
MTPMCSAPFRAWPAATAAALLAMLAGPEAQAQDASPRGGEPRIERKVSEDDNVRIEELIVRGETQRIVVRSKVAGTRPYEILPAGGGRDLSQDKRAIGQRVWSVLSF